MLNLYRTGSLAHCTSGHASVLDAHGEESDSLIFGPNWLSDTSGVDKLRLVREGKRTTRDRRRLRIGPTYRAPLRYDPTIFSTSPRGLLSGPPAFPFYHRGIVLDLPTDRNNTTHHLLNFMMELAIRIKRFAGNLWSRNGKFEKEYFNARRKPAPPSLSICDSDKDGLAGAPFENGGLTQFRGAKSRLNCFKQAKAA
ncbi:hypothetical protein CCUS01_02496 [Colletotrichum cuscutae]|uniref:Uncharacterized protein n=1 Tax=Colletotrichum cuscutae TaxID=1209917 RepID=A0AAI9TVV2_9PEZI|nr:hypothetical protein CCUS01_02496 [Colletotrichum cuscutae]